MKKNLLTICEGAKLMKINYAFVHMLILCLAIILLSNVGAYENDDSVEQLINIIRNANLVIQGQVISTYIEYDDHNTPTRIVKVWVHDVIKGKLEDRIITLRYPLFFCLDLATPMYPSFQNNEKNIRHFI